MQISVSQQTSRRMHCADISTGPSLIQQKALQFGPEANTYLLRRKKQLFTFQKTCSVFRPVQLFTPKYYYSILPQLRRAPTVLPCHDVSTDWSQRKSHFRRKKNKNNQTESRQWSSTAQAHIKKVFVLREKVQRHEPLIKVISKGKHAKTQAEQMNPSAFQLIPDTVSSMPHWHRQYNSTIYLSVWAKPKAFSSAAAQCE